MIKSYVMRGRMSDAQERSYHELSPRYCVPFSQEPVLFETIFGNSNPVTCEIGFGMGKATADIAEANPRINYIGIEVYRAGIGKLLWEIEKRGLQNIRIVEHDAVEVLEYMFPDMSVAAFHIFFPDPWPKKRHHKRRLVQRPFTGLLERKLARGAYIYMVSDWSDYAAFALGELSATAGLQNAFDTFAPPQSWRPQTKFEAKGLAKEHTIKELLFKKI